MHKSDFTCLVVGLDRADGFENPVSERVYEGLLVCDVQVMQQIVLNTLKIISYYFDFDYFVEISWRS